MNILQIECFLSTAEMGSMRKAADSLYLSQPTVSQHITTLESELGFNLFNRTNRGVTLSDAGSVLFEDLRSVMRDLEIAVRRASMFAHKGECELKLGIGNGFIPDSLSSITSLYKEAYPKVTITITQTTSNNLIDELLQGKFDVCFGIKAPAYEERGLAFEHLINDEMIVYVPLGCSLSEKKSVSLHDLSGYNLIMPKSKYAGLSHILLEQYILDNSLDIRITIPPVKLMFVLGLEVVGSNYVVAAPSFMAPFFKNMHPTTLEESFPLEYGLIHTVPAFPATEDFIRIAKKIAHDIVPGHLNS